MPITNKNLYRGSDFNNQELKDVKSIQLNQDATLADEVVRKSQSESISALAAQNILKTLLSEASNVTAFTSLSIKGFLEGKQDNLEIDSSSTSYLQIVDGYKIKATQLLITDVEVNETCSTLQMFIDTYSPSKQEGDVVILTSASNNQERSWIKTSNVSQGVDGYTRLQTDYNVTSIRTMFSSGAFLSYSQSSGQYALVTGLLGTQLGAQTLPMDSNKFSVLSLSNDTQEKVNLALESYIESVDTNATGGVGTVNLRLNNLSGVDGNNMQLFTGNFYSNNATIKQLFVETETALSNATSDRALIRSEFSDADNGLQLNINSETNARVNAVNGEANIRLNEDLQLQSNINQTNSDINDEINRATSAENALSNRADIFEGDVSTIGSISKAQSDSQIFATNAVNGEASLRITGDANLQTQIDALQGAFQYKGFVDSSGRITHVDSLNPNNNQVFENATFTEGEFYKINSNLTITFSDNSALSLNNGDGLIVINTKSVAGTAVASDFHKGDNTENADILREGMLDNTTIEKTGNEVKVKNDSITRVQLDSNVEVDIDNKVLKSGDIMSGALQIDKVVGAGAGYTGGYDFSSYIKMKSIDTSSLTNTQRALLVENEVYTDGSGNPFDLDYANGATISTHYKGGSNDLTVAIVGLNGEGRVLNPLSAVYSTGVYGSSIDPQLGVNAGATLIAQNGATANLGMFAFCDTAGALNNRGAYIALSTDTVDFDAYRVARVSDPLPVQNAALIIDDYTGISHAAYINGKVEINGPVIIPNASNDTHAVNLGDIKNKEKEFTVNIPALDSVTINHQFDSKKLLFTLWLNDESVDDGFKVERTSTNSIKIYNNTIESVDGLEVLLYKFSI